MANPTVLAGVVNDFTILQNQRVIDMNPVIQQIENDVAPLVVALTKAGNKPARSQTVQWLEDQLVPRRTTLAIAALIGDLTITVAASTGQFFRARDVLRFVNNGEQVVVTGVAGDVLTIVRAQGNVAATAVAINTDILKVGNAALEGATLGTLLQTKKVAASNFCQIQRDPFGFTNTALASEMYGGALDSNEKSKKFIEHMRQRENTWFFGQRKLDTSGAAPVGYAGGLIDYIASNITTPASNILTQAAFETFLRTGARYGSREKVLFASPLIRSAIASWPLGRLAPPDNKAVNSWGTAVEGYLSGTGGLRISIIEKRDWSDFDVSVAGNQAKSPAGQAFLVDMANVQNRPLRDTGYITDRQAPDEDSKKNEYLTEWCPEVNLEQTHALLTGVLTYAA